jgi:hypothetical protein
MKRTQSYFMYFLFGAMFGLIVTFGIPQSIVDYIGHGTSNIFIYGAIGYSIFAIKNKEYKKIWNVFYFIILAFLMPFLTINLVSLILNIIY